MPRSYFDKLVEHHSFSLQRVSPTTFPQDVITTCHRRGDKLSKAETEAIVKLVRTGSCYRCRIAKGRYHYGTSANAAIKSAIDNHRKAGKCPRKT